MGLRSSLHIFSGRILYYALLPAFIVIPSTRTRGLLFDEKGRILLVKNWIGSGLWDLPGGGMRRDEPATACIRREVSEETGIDVKENAWSFIASRRVYSTTYVCLTAITRSRHPHRKRFEISHTAWFAKDALPSHRNPLIDELISVRHGH